MKITEYELIKINKETKEKKRQIYNIEDNVEINEEKNNYMFKILQKDGYFIYKTDDIYSKCLSLMKTYNTNIKDFLSQYEYITVEEYEKKLKEYEEEQEKLREKEKEQEQEKNTENMEK